MNRIRNILQLKHNWSRVIALKLLLIQLLTTIKAF